MVMHVAFSCFVAVTSNVPDLISKPVVSHQVSAGDNTHGASMQQLINTVNNLNAQWIVLQRDVITSKNVTRLLQSQIRNIHDDTGTLKASLRQLRETSRGLTERLQQLEGRLDGGGGGAGNRMADDGNYLQYDHAEDLQQEIHELRYVRHAHRHRR